MPVKSSLVPLSSCFFFLRESQNSMQMPGSSIIQHPFRLWTFHSFFTNHAVGRSGASYLSAGQAALLCHGSVLLLETLAKSLRALEELVDAAHNAALLLGEERLGGEVGDAVGEAALDEVGVHVHEVLHLLALHAALQLALLSGVKHVHSAHDGLR